MLAEQLFQTMGVKLVVSMVGPQMEFSLSQEFAGGWRKQHKLTFTVDLVSVAVHEEVQADLLTSLLDLKDASSNWTRLVLAEIETDGSSVRVNLRLRTRKTFDKLKNVIKKWGKKTQRNLGRRRILHTLLRKGELHAAEEPEEKQIHPDA